MDLNECQKTSPKPLDEIIYGYRASHILRAAVEKRIFTGLSAPKDAHQIAAEAGTDPRTTEKFLNVLSASGLLIRSGDKYLNSAEAGTFLDESSFHSLSNLVRISVGSSQFLAHLREALKNGGPVQVDFSFDSVQLLGHAEWARSIELERVFNVLKNLRDFAEARKILDLGGGHGIFSMAMAQGYPGLEVTLFDQPPVIEFARKFISSYGMEDKIKLISGDFNKDDIGQEYDLVFVSHVLYQSSNLDQILNKIYGSLNEGGMVVLNHWVMDDLRTGPAISVIFDLYLSIISREFGCHTAKEYADLLRATGFGRIRLFDIGTPHTPTMMVVGCKGDA